MNAANNRSPPIEDIILAQDKRGISNLRPFLPVNYCQEAARWVLAQRALAKKSAIITTGFYILSSQALKIRAANRLINLKTLMAVRKGLNMQDNIAKDIRQRIRQGKLVKPQFS